LNNHEGQYSTGTVGLWTGDCSASSLATAGLF